MRLGRALKRLVAMIAKPDVASAARGHEIRPVVIRLVVVNVMHVQRSADLFLCNATALARVIVPLSNRLLGFVGELWTVREATNTASPRVVLWPTLPHASARFGFVLLTKERISFAKQLPADVGLAYALAKLCGVLPSSRQLVDAVIAIKSGLLSALNLIGRQLLTEMNLSGAWIWTPLVPCLMTLPEQSRARRRIFRPRVMSVSKLGWLSIDGVRRDARSTTARAFDGWFCHAALFQALAIALNFIRSGHAGY